MCVGSYPDRLIHGPHPSYWVPYRSDRLWAAADRGLGTTEQLSLTDTQWLRHAGIPEPPRPHTGGGVRMGCVDTAFKHCWKLVKIMQLLMKLRYHKGSDINWECVAFFFFNQQTK